MSRTLQVLRDNRVHSRAPMAEASAERARQAIADHIDAPLQDLLAYLESRNPRDEDGISELGYYEAIYEGPAYGDAASRLRKILDGE